MTYVWQISVNGRNAEFVRAETHDEAFTIYSNTRGGPGDEGWNRGVQSISIQRLGLLREALFT